jgi:predicted Kef-type K+ transport protein
MPHDTPLITTIVAALTLAWVFAGMAHRLKCANVVVMGEHQIAKSMLDHVAKGPSTAPKRVGPRRRAAPPKASI